MATDCITIRFPSGDWEYGFSDSTPEVGDTLARQGKSWVVVGVTHSMDDTALSTMALAPEMMDHDRPDLRL